MPLSRRDLLKGFGATAAAALPANPAVASFLHRRQTEAGWVTGHLTGAQAVVETLLHLGVECVFGIPGAQQNELWDTMKSRHLPYLLVTHEFSASTMADGYARSKGKPGVICIVPGHGLTNALSGIGEALLDSVPMVCIVGDVANGEKYHPFQVHEMRQAELLMPLTKAVYGVSRTIEIVPAIQQAYRLAQAGEPGPVAVIIPYNLLLSAQHFHCPPLPPCPVPFDEAAFAQAMRLLGNRRFRVGIYAGMGCMDYSPQLVHLAEVLQAPVATSISGKGVIPENHPLAVGWGYGPQGTRTAEGTFRHLDLVLAIGVKYAEVSTGFYSQPQTRHLIHVDINPHNLGRIMRTDVCVNADAGLFLERALAEADCIRRPPNARLVNHIQHLREAEARTNAQMYARCGADPMAFIATLRRLTCPDALTFMDVSCSQYWVAETFTTMQPRTFFNPTNNQAMGWSIPAALGAQQVNPGRQVVTITGDGCFLMSAMEISTAARAGLPVKFFVLDDQAYHYMQRLQRPAYLRTTATILARLDYAALARGFGVAYQEIICNQHLEGGIRAALNFPGPVLVRVATDYRGRPIRWVDAARQRFTQELSPAQKVRFLARIGSRSLDHHPQND
jgi:acetolactate synthase I/II/III large subunit